MDRATPSSLVKRMTLDTALGKSGKQSVVTVYVIGKAVNKTQNGTWRVLGLR